MSGGSGYKDKAGIVISNLMNITGTCAGSNFNPSQQYSLQFVPYSSTMQPFSMLL